MKPRMTLIALAFAGTLAAAGAMAHGGPGYGHAGGYGPGARGPASIQQVTQRLDVLKAELKLAPNQMGAWNAWQTTVLSNVQARNKMMESMPARGDRDAMGDFRVSMMKFNAQAAEQSNAARKALVATMSAEQKASFDRVGPGTGRGPGMGSGMGSGRGAPCTGPGA